jgi:colanic acid/amylovoran biosynthesis protein
VRGTKDSEPVSFLLVDFFSPANKGDLAILRGMLSIVRQHYPDVTITVSSFRPYLTERYIDEKVVHPILNTHGLQKKPWSIFPVVYRVIVSVFRKIGFPLFPPVGEEFRVFLESDVMLHVGGATLNDNYRPAIAGRLLLLWIAAILGKRVIIYNQSIGPFNSFLYRRLAYSVFDRIDLVITRDQTTSKHLAPLLEIPVIAGADAAWVTVPDSRESAREAMRRQDNVVIDENRINVSFSVRRWKYTITKKRGSLLLDEIARTADTLQERCAARIYFLSTCTSLGGYGEDDRKTAENVAYRMKEPAVILKGDYRPEEYAAIYGMMDFHIGMRMHSNIFAALGLTPFWAIQYEKKMKHLLEDLDLTDCCTDIHDEDQVRRMSCDIVHAFQERDMLRKRLISRRNGMISRAEQGGTFLRSIL